MSIQLFSVSQKVTPLSIREKFAFQEEEILPLMNSLKKDGIIQEVVVLVTCNRTEIYVYSEEKECRVYENMIRCITKFVKCQDEFDMANYYRLYHGKQAIHHLFMVTAGLDSMLLGEDQILGQVKKAHEFAKDVQMCGTYLNTLFRYCITGAKCVKTKTNLSKTPVSTATLAIKVLKDTYGSLKNRNIMIIGSSGKIGSIVFKNLQGIEDVNLYVTMRGIDKVQEMTMGHHGETLENTHYTAIPYDKRYEWVHKMDGVISATASPHYTITTGKFKDNYQEETIVFVDLAVPMDIESTISQFPTVTCCHMDDLKQEAKENNERKKEEIGYAKHILMEYETQFMRWFYFQQNISIMEQVTTELEQEMEQKGTKKAIKQFFYRIRETVSPEEMKQFFEILEEYENQKEEKI